MTSAHPHVDPASLPAPSKFETRGEFQAAWRSALSVLAEHGSREIYMCDSSYADWPLGEQASVDALTRWAMSHRRLVVIAAEFDTIQRQHPRWVNWRKTWSHIVECRQVAEQDITSIPSMLLVPDLLSLRVHDPIHFRGRLSFTRPEEVRDWDDLDAFLQRSHDAFPVTKLGL